MKGYRFLRSGHRLEFLSTNVSTDWERDEMGQGHGYFPNGGKQQIKPQDFVWGCGDEVVLLFVSTLIDPNFPATHSFDVIPLWHNCRSVSSPQWHRSMLTKPPQLWILTWKTSVSLDRSLNDGIWHSLRDLAVNLQAKLDFWSRIIPLYRPKC